METSEEDAEEVELVVVLLVSVCGGKSMLLRLVPEASAAIDVVF